MSSGKIIVQLHNFSSISLAKDFISTALSLGARDIVFSHASGSAATTGVPLAHKLAHSKKVNFLYLQDISDSLELLSPDEVYLFIRRPYSQETFDPSTITQNYLSGKTILLIFGGSDPGLSKRDLDFGVPLYFADINDLPCLSELTLALYLLRKEVIKQKSS
ncbi:MAG: RecB-family nuclease [Candidatus Heimdallarchaeaceae archaeon]